MQTEKEIKKSESARTEDARRKGQAIVDTICQLAYVPLNLDEIKELGLDNQIATSRMVNDLVREKLGLAERTRGTSAVKTEILSALKLSKESKMADILEAIKNLQKKK